MKQETIARIRRFTKERDWEQYHTPANLAKSISIEAGELLECFQWSDTDYDLTHAGEELADVMVYCQNMLDALGLDADAIINAKMDQKRDDQTHYERPDLPRAEVRAGDGDGPADRAGSAGHAGGAP